MGLSFTLVTGNLVQLPSSQLDYAYEWALFFLPTAAVVVVVTFYSSRIKKLGFLLSRVSAENSASKIVRHSRVSLLHGSKQ